MYEDIDIVTLFTNHNYKVSISFTLARSHMRPVNCVFDTGVGPILLSEGFIEPIWLPSVLLCDGPRLESATKQRVKMVRQILLHVRIRESCIHVMFEIVRNFAVFLMLVTLIIDKFIKVISP